MANKGGAGPGVSVSLTRIAGNFGADAMVQEAFAS